MPCPLPRSLAAGPGRRPAAWPQHAGQEATQGPARRLREGCRSLLAPWLRSPQLMPLGRGQTKREGMALGQLREAELEKPRRRPASPCRPGRRDLAAGTRA